MKEAIRDETASLIYTLHYFLSSGRIRRDSTMDELEAAMESVAEEDTRTIARLIEENPLKVYEIRVFSLKIGQGRFAFVFAANEEEAKSFVRHKYGIEPKNCFQYPIDFPVSIGNRFTTFREMARAKNSFPSLAGFYQKEVRE
ncbi:hypothetical protein [Geobacillus thermodenitrificans]|jgi:hypothetical protein|uniref:Uncharacterized protein n=1 Tax=Geobacillus thermodenitrificans TaxID=33940 RepID=A0ABY9Q7V6_GEOTD|nr:hypothetical protein [Geobacillus thermodenitrificans]WMV75009.1 hypothetical protein HSX42_11995 [Geobacillus thermodenitrificans]